MEDDNSVDLRRVLQVSLLFEFNLMTNSYITRRFSEGVAGRGLLGRIVETISGEPVAAGIRASIGGTRAVDTDEQHGLAAGWTVGAVVAVVPVVVGSHRHCSMSASASALIRR